MTKTTSKAVRDLSLIVVMALFFGAAALTLTLVLAEYCAVAVSEFVDHAVRSAGNVS